MINRKAIAAVGTAVLLLGLMAWGLLTSCRSAKAANSPSSQTTLQEMPNVGPLETEKVWTVVTPTTTNTASYKEVSSPEMGQFWLKQGKKDENYYYFKNKSPSPMPYPFPAPVTQVVTQQVPVIIYVTVTNTITTMPPAAPITISATATASAVATNGVTTTVVTQPVRRIWGGCPPHLEHVTIFWSQVGGCR